MDDSQTGGMIDLPSHAPPVAPSSFISSIPFVGNYLHGFIHPSQYYESKKESSLLSSLAILFFMGMVVNALSSARVYLSLGFDISSVISILMVAPLIAFIVSLVAFCIVFVAARLLGGKGSIGQTILAQSLVMSALLVWYVPFLLISSLGGFFAIFSVVLIVLSLYAFYGYIVVVRQAQSLSTGRAAVAVLSPLILAAILVFALVSIAFIGFFPGLATDSATTQSTAYWRGEARPFAILEQSVSADGKATLMLQNYEASGTLTLNSVKLGAVTSQQNIAFAPGEVRTITIDGLPAGAKGENYDLPVEISYKSPSGTQNKQFGAKLLHGKYS